METTYHSGDKLILGVDPSTTEAGLALVEGDSIIFAESLKLEGSLIERYFALAQHVEELCQKWQPAAVAIENAYVGPNPQSALKLSVAIGAALYAASQHVGIDDVHLLTPAEIKQEITGNGRADKEAVRRMVEFISGAAIRNEHVSDAAAAGLTLLRILR
jgi:crossover junction endodeoxyribonuclease RuvC